MHTFQIFSLVVKLVKTIHPTKKKVLFLEFFMNICHNSCCSAYGVWYKEELETGISSTGTPNVDWNYKETFYAKPRYPALDIAYLAVREEYRGNKVGQ